MNEIGHNQPPGMIEFAEQCANDLSEWMKGCPVIQNQEQAKDAKRLLDRAFLTLKDLEDDKKRQTSPLREEITAIQDRYRGPHKLLDGVNHELTNRLQAYLLAEELRKREEARIANEKAEMLRHAAEAAKLREREALEDAAHGALDIDTAGAMADTNAAFTAAGKAARDAARKENAIHTKVTSDLGRKASSLRSKEILSVENATVAIEAIGLTSGIAEAILTSARAYRSQYGELPPGIKQETQAKVV